MEFWSGVLETAVRLMIPIMLAALGELIAERAGVMNLALEAYMAVGAYLGFIVMLSSGNVWMAALAAVLGGMFAASFMVVASVLGRANQILAGFALFILFPGFVGYLYAQRAPSEARIPSLPVLEVPILSHIPIVGRALFEQNGFWYLAVGLCLLSWFVLTRTRLGLYIDACGHDPEVAHSKGIDVAKVRTFAVLTCGALGGLGGMALTVGALGSFNAEVVGGRGFIAIAVVILGGWKVGRTVLAAAAIGVFDSLQLHLGGKVDVPVQLLGALPWLVVLVMLIVAARLHSPMPRALGKTIELD